MVLNFRLPEGERLQRRFLKSDNVDVSFSFIKIDFLSDIVLVY
jgi:hypothetical protein